MATFKDTEGREWVLKITVSTVKAVREGNDGIDLADMTGKSFMRLADDPVLLVDTLWRLVEKQAVAQAVAPDDFGVSMGGDAIEEATIALQAAIVDFFPSRKRKIFLRLMAASDKIRNRGQEIAIERATGSEMLEALEANLDKQYQEALTQLRLPTSTPESSD